MSAEIYSLLCYRALLHSELMGNSTVLMYHIMRVLIVRMLFRKTSFRFEQISIIAGIKPTKKLHFVFLIK